MSFQKTGKTVTLNTFDSPKQDTQERKVEAQSQDKPQIKKVNKND